MAIQALIADVGRHMGRAIAHLTAILNVQHVIIGGSIARFGDVLLNAIVGQLNQSVLRRIAEQTQIEFSALGADIVILGAVALVLARELGVV